jgi:chromosome segregation ATPase
VTDVLSVLLTTFASHAERMEDGEGSMRVHRAVVAACGVAMVFATMVSGQQQQRPATADDILAELRSLRADVNQAAENALRTQLLTVRLAAQESRLSTLNEQLNSVRQQQAQAQLTLAPFTLQLKQAQESNSEILAPLRATMEQVQKREQELRAQEAELVRLVQSEEARWGDFNARLDEMERALAASPRR